MIIGVRRLVYAVGLAGAGVAVYNGVKWVGGLGDYAVPEEMCGVAAPSSLERLLPDGDEIEVRDEDVSSAVNVLSMCYFVVDDEGALTTVVSRWGVDTDLAEEYRDTPRAYGFLGSETTIHDEPAVLGRDGSVVQVPCPGLGEDRAMQIVVRYHAAGTHDPDEDERNVRAFTEDLIALYGDEYGCG